MMKQQQSNPEIYLAQNKKNVFIGQRSTRRSQPPIQSSNPKQSINSTSMQGSSNIQMGYIQDPKLETLKTLELTSMNLQNSMNSHKQIHIMPQILMNGEQPLEIRKNSSIDDKKQAKKIKRRRIITKDAQQFLPDFLACLSEYHYKHTIREGWKYQAIIPEQSGHRHKTYKLVSLWKSNDDFDEQVFKDFKLKFGENRNQEELCLIKIQLQCNWKQVPRYLEANKDVYKKVFKQKDRNIAKLAKTAI